MPHICAWVILVDEAAADELELELPVVLVLELLTVVHRAAAVPAAAAADRQSDW